MRIRQVKPAFWGDSLMASLPEGTRLFYIGLWMLADDAGWIDWDLAEVGHELYGYESRPKREHRVEKMLGVLESHGRVVVHPCGHVEVPRIKEHQHLAGQEKQVRTVLNEHLKGCLPQGPANPRDDPRTSASKGNGKYMEGEGRARAPEGAAPRGDLREGLTRHGIRPEIIDGGKAS